MQSVRIIDAEKDLTSTLKLLDFACVSYMRGMTEVNNCFCIILNFELLTEK